MIIVREEMELRHMLAKLLGKHRKIEGIIEKSMNNVYRSNDIDLQKLKKEKLRLKDEVSAIKCMLRPNIVA